MTVALVSRQGRQLQRYNSCGSRLIVGCIPYKVKTMPCDPDQAVEVLVISSSKKRQEIMFPKGGWEQDESIIQAANRETFEEAGVLGHLEVSVQTFFVYYTILSSFVRGGSSLTRTAFHGSQDSLGRWRYKSKSHDKIHEAVMFPLNVTEELYYWPEKAIRTRKWIGVAEAMAECKHSWMKEALARLVKRLSSEDLEMIP
ncbi:Nudix hydrolase [Musa troglodytarum]|uniref:Nudix hydrolase n=1 Tax=Musa troglodytarum TaxID=320322 RepID=A0A9E7KFK0_9LILI|nr:Nudix hydrolase [Musa troglodytarum]